MQQDKNPAPSIIPSLEKPIAAEKPVAAKPPEAAPLKAEPPPKPGQVLPQDLNRVTQLQERARAAILRAKTLRSHAEVAAAAADSAEQDAEVAELEQRRFGAYLDVLYQLGPSDKFNILSGVIARTPHNPPRLEVAK